MKKGTGGSPETSFSSHLTPRINQENGKKSMSIFNLNGSKYVFVIGKQAALFEVENGIYISCG
jgi:hypothetical protein